MKKLKNWRVILTTCSILIVLAISSLQVVQASTEENKTLYRRAAESFAKGDVDGMLKIVDPNFVDHNPSPGQAPGVEGLKQMMIMFHQAFPDMQIAIEDLIAEGDKVAARMTATGTNKGELMGMAPTGKKISITGVDIFRIANGKVVERWGNFDDLGMMRQLGVIPTQPGQSSGMPPKKEPALHKQEGFLISAEKSKALSRRIFEDIFNRGNLVAMDEIFTKDFVSHDPAEPPETPAGLEGLKQAVVMYRTAFPNMQAAVEDQVAEGNKVVTRWKANGIHKGGLMGIAPTGKSVTITGITIDRTSGGKIAESWINWDTLGLMQQLGVIPMPTPPK